MKIIDVIKKALKAKGIDQKHASRIEKTYKVEKEEDVNGAIESFEADILPAITEATEKAKKDAEEAAKKTAIEEYEKAHNLKDGKPIDDPNPDPDGKKAEGLDPKVKALLDAQNKQIADLKTLIEGGQKKAGDDAKRATAIGLLKDAKLPDEWISRVDVNSDTSLEDQVKGLSDEYTNIQQQAIDARVASGDFAPGGFAPKDRSVEDWTKLMDSDNTPNNPGAVDLGLSK